MNCIEAVNEPLASHLTCNSVFLAGGIVGCPDWQATMINLLSDQDNLTLLNPRRKNFPITDPDAAPIQIEWEHRMLRVATAISFWFPQETLCPIVLYELGAWSMMDKPIFIGVHPSYQRRIDVEVQTHLNKPKLEIAYSLEDLASQVKDYVSFC